MAPMDAIWLFQCFCSLAHHFVAPHHPHPPLLWSACGIVYATEKLSKMADNSTVDAWIGYK